MYTRRQLLLSGTLLAASTLLPAAPVRRRRIGHTGITWGYSPQQAPVAIAEVGRLGYQGFESFGSVLEYWSSRGGLHDALSQAGVPLIGAYFPLLLTDAGKRQDEVAKAVRWGHLLRAHGGNIAVIGPDNVARDTFDFNAVAAPVIDTLAAVGRALHDIGVTAALHQHTGSSVMTRDELYRVLDGVDERYLKICPDTGELLAAGVDPLRTITDWLPRIAHVHLKDYNAGGDHDGYCPIGEGRIDFAPILDVLESAAQPFLLMAELNPTARDALSPDPRSAAVLAELSSKALRRLGLTFQR